MNYDQFWHRDKIEQEPKAPVQSDNWEDAFDFDEEQPQVSEDSGTTLISPDTYDYLDNADSNDFIYDNLPDEQDYVLDDSDSDAECYQKEESLDDSSMYSGSSLFDMDDEDTEVSQVEEIQAEQELACVPAEEQNTEQQLDGPIAEQTENSESVAEAVQTIESVMESAPVPVVESEPKVIAEAVVDSNIELDEPEVKSESKPVEDVFNPTDPLILEILGYVGKDNTFGSYLKTLTDSDLSDLAKFIDSTRVAWMDDGRDKMFNLPGSDITVSVLNEMEDPMTAIQRIQGVGIQMFAHDKENWNWLKLYFTADGILKRASIQKISKECFSDWQWRIVQNEGRKLWMANNKSW